MIFFSCPHCKGILAAEQSEIDTVVECQHCNKVLHLTPELVAKERVHLEAAPQTERKRRSVVPFAIVGILLLLLLLAIRMCENTKPSEVLTPPAPDTTTFMPDTTNTDTVAQDTVNWLDLYRPTIEKTMGRYVVVVQNTSDSSIANSSLQYVVNVLQGSQYVGGVTPDDTVNPTSYNVIVYGFADWSEAENAKPALYNILRRPLNLTTPTQLQTEMLFR